MPEGLEDARAVITIIISMAGVIGLFWGTSRLKQSHQEVDLDDAEGDD